MSFVTVGVPVYNEEKTLHTALKSIITSAKFLNNPYEIIVCFSEHTSDNGREIAKKFKENYFPKLKITQSPKGKTKAITKIVNESKGDIIIFCDADVTVEPDCFRNLISNFSKPTIMTVTGCPKPYPMNNFIYKVVNARMCFPRSEIAKTPINENNEKPFIHGRIYAFRKKVFTDKLNIKKFEQSIGDDTFLTHFIILNYGRNALFRDYDAVVNYLAVQSITSWWKKWSRIWEDLKKLYEDNPGFIKLKPFLQTKLDWRYIFSQNFPVLFYFILERILHNAGKIYFELTKNKRRGWKRLEDTKRAIT